MKRKETESQRLVRNAQLRQRYATDIEYRRRIIERQRGFYKGMTEFKRKKDRLTQYWKDPSGNCAKTKEWRRMHHEKFMLRQTKYRVEHRPNMRAHAKEQAATLTDSYVRNQLSKYSHKSTHEWTQLEVNAKRRKILSSRAKRVTQEKAALIRHEYSGSNAKALADKYGVSHSLICLVIRNKLHKTEQLDDVQRIITTRKSFIAMQTSNMITP